MNSFLIGIAGQPPITNFEMVNNCLVTSVANPASVGSIYFTLTQPIGDNFAAALFFSQPPFNSTEFLCVVADQSPSQIVSTGFAQNASVAYCAEIKLVM